MHAALSSVSRRIAALEAEDRHDHARLNAVEFAHSVGLEDLDGWQEDLLLSTAPRILLNITRQGGKSTMSGVLAVHKALTAPGSLTLILAPSERQARETFGKAQALLPAGAPIESDRKLGVELRNGSRIEALPGSERTVRGFSGVDLLILDEASRIEDALYYAVRPMLAVSGGRIIMPSTPHGKRGVFFEEWENGSGWERYEVNAHRIPRIPADFLAEERASMPLALFEQEYLCKFTETSDEVFTHALVVGAIDETVKPLQLGDEW